MTSSAVLALDLLWPGIAAAAAAAAVLPWCKRSSVFSRALVLGVTIVLLARYIVWRGFHTLPDMAFSVDFISAAVFYAVELIALIGASMNLMFLTRIRNRSKDADASTPWLAAQDPPPLVDVLICTYNEEHEILERTIIGAQGMTYPSFRVWVCDDGKRPWLAELCERLGCGYITRPDNRHAKAGNINHALSYLGKLPQQPAFISILDADFVPRAQFLNRAMTLFADPAVGIVQTPQHFVNPDPIQSNLSASSAWPDEQRFFFDIVMASKDAWGTAFCCGTSSVIRYRPLVEMGGFPTDSVTEDYLVTLRLKERGLGTAYLNEPLTLGLAPEGLKEYITQRGRWCLGFIQIFRGRSGPFSLSTSLSFLDRLSLVEVFIFWSFGYAYRLLAILVPAAYLLFGIKAVEADVTDLLHHFLPYFTWNMLVIGWVAKGRILPIMSDVCQLIAAPTILKSVVVGLLRPKNQRFKVTAKGGDRSSRFVEWPLMRLFLFLLVLTTAGVASAWISDQHEGGGTGLMAVVWSWYNIVVLTIACFVCLEQPRYRRTERFAASERVIIESGDRPPRIAVLADLSTGGARVIGPPAGPVGATITLAFAGLRLPARIVRSDPEDFAVQFEDSPETRAMLIRRLYAGNYGHAFDGVKAVDLGLTLARRLFR